MRAGAARADRAPLPAHRPLDVVGRGFGTDGGRCTRAGGPGWLVCLVCIGQCQRIGRVGSAPAASARPGRGWSRGSVRTVVDAPGLVVRDGLVCLVCIGQCQRNGRAGSAPAASARPRRRWSRIRHRWRSMHPGRRPEMRRFARCASANVNASAVPPRADRADRAVPTAPCRPAHRRPDPPGSAVADRPPSPLHHALHDIHRTSPTSIKNFGTNGGRCTQAAGPK
jgi:hypothetical protein